MDRNREARRAPMAASIGLSRRRHRSSNLRDSPDDDSTVELPEMARLRDRGSLKKDRDRERDRLSRSKRRRGDRLMQHGSNREDGDESSEESVNDDEDEDDDDGGVGVGVRMLPPNHHPPSLSSSSIQNQNHHRKSYPPPAKVFRAVAPTWKPADEMIGVSVPRKARSASTKRSHECWVSGGGVSGEQIHGQASTSPARTSLTAAAAAPAPLSPTSSNASVRKKIKSNGAKHRPPKSSSKSSSSAQDEIEIEIAEVLYGMMRQPLVPSKQENIASDSMKLEPRDPNKLGTDAKSRVSSPISNSPAQPLLNPPQNSGSSVTHISAIAPKRKRPRPVKYEDENPPNFAVRSSPISKAETDQPGNNDAPETNPGEAAGSAAENGGVAETVPESVKLESHPSEGSKVLSEESESGDVVARKEEAQTVTKAVSTTCGEIETQLEEKFQIDLMAPPPSRSSPEGEGEIEFVAVDPKPMVSDVDMEQKKDGDGGMNMEAAAPLEKKAKLLAEEEIVNSSKNKDRVVELQLELEKPERDCTFPPANNKPPVIHKHHQPISDKAQHQANSVSMPMNVAGWPGALPPMGYMAPLQGVVSMDGSNVPSAAAASAAMQPPHLVFTQPRPKRCATHCYIARNICYQQQFTRINPFWPAAAGSASLYGPKACNLNVLPPAADLHTNIPGRSVNSPQDKGQGVAVFPVSKDKPSQASFNMVDAAQRKQMYALPPGAPSNILHGPAFIFPLSQQQAAAASARSGSVKSPAAGHNSASSGASVSATAAAASSARAAGAATAMSFNYPNMPGNETQYLAILQNNAYPFPIPTHVGAPAYRGTHGQAMPFFSGSFYSSQMLHPSQIQQQQQLPAQSQQSQQGHQAQQSQQGHQAQQSHQSQQQSHQNSSISGGSSSSQKQLHSSHQRAHGNSSGNLQGFPAPKNQPTQQLQSQQRQHQQHQQNLVSLQARQIEGEMGGEDRSKAGAEALQSSAFAMSLASINGATTNGIDISSFTQNHAILQSLPQATRHGYQIMAAAAAAQAAQQKKSYRFSEEGKGGSADASEEERKVVGGKPAAPVGQSIAFSRPDLTDTSSTVPSNTVIDSSSVRTLNLGSTPTWATGSVMPAAAMTSVNASLSQQQLQWQQQQQQQQMMQLQKQHHFASAAAAVARSKTPASNGNAYSDHLPSSPSMASKFPTLSAFPQSLVQSSGSPGSAQSPQWKNSGRTATSQAPSLSMASSTSSSLKNLSQQQGRAQQNHTQISFAANSKPSNTSQVQQIPNNNQSSSPPVMVGSPTSSMSKGAGGSPRATTSASTGNKVGQASTLSSHQSKNSPSQPSRKSSPVGGRNVPSILGNPHNTSSSAGTKHQFSQQQQHQQAQLLFSNYMQAQATHSPSPSSTASGASGFYLQRRRAEQQQQQQQGTSSSGMLSLCPPVSHANVSTADPAKAVAAAAASMKGGGLPSQGILHAAQFAAAQSSGNAHQLLPGGFTYGVHTVSSAVQGKSTEQKQQPAEEEQTRNDFALNRGSTGGYKS